MGALGTVAKSLAASFATSYVWDVVILPHLTSNPYLMTNVRRKSSGIGDITIKGQDTETSMNAQLRNIALKDVVVAVSLTAGLLIGLELLFSTRRHKAIRVRA